MQETALATCTPNVTAVEINADDVKKYIAPNATDKELFMFMNISKSYGLNPFKREIHFVKYGQNPGQTIVGYESYIKRAERTGLLDGWDITLGKDELGEKAIITIYRKDRNKPFIWPVYRHEFDTQQANWKKMPLFMLRKVAISQGFRLAFPEELGGMPYIPEELPATSSQVMSESLPVQDVEVVEAEVVEEPELVSEFEAQTLEALAKQYKANTKVLLQTYKVDSFSQFTKAQLADAINKLKAKYGEKAA